MRHDDFHTEEDRERARLEELAESERQAADYYAHQDAVGASAVLEHGATPIAENLNENADRSPAGDQAAAEALAQAERLAAAGVDISKLVAIIGFDQTELPFGAVLEVRYRLTGDVEPRSKFVHLDGLP